MEDKEFEILLSLISSKDRDSIDLARTIISKIKPDKRRELCDRLTENYLLSLPYEVMLRDTPMGCIEPIFITNVPMGFGYNYIYNRTELVQLYISEHTPLDVERFNKQFKKLSDFLFDKRITKTI